MPNLNVIESAKMISNDQHLVTSDVYKDDGSTDLVKGMLYKLDGGTITKVVATAGTADSLDTDLLTAGQYFIALEDKTADGGFVTVQQVTEDTIFEGFVVDSVGTAVTLAQTAIGTAYAGYANADSQIGVDAGVTTKGVFVIVDVDSNYDPYRSPDEDGFDQDTDGTRHGRVKFRLLKSLFA